MLKKASKISRAFLFALCALTATAVNAQSKQNNSITLPSSPSMPSVKMPSVGSGEFYGPSSKDFYSPYKSAQTNKQSNTETQDSTATETTQSLTQNSTASRVNSITTDLQDSSSLYNTLTAGNINSLSNMGFLNRINSITGKGAALNQTGLTSVSDSDKTLQEILKQLSDLKDKIGQEELSSNINNEQNTAQILRFNVNGYDVKATCREIFISQPDRLESILISGDRRYQSDGKTRTETFYMLFQCEGTKDGLIQYGVTTEVSQDSENPYSFLYQLSQRGRVTAKRTGNFITLRINDDKWRMDMLVALN